MSGFECFIFGILLNKTFPASFTDELDEINLINIQPSLFLTSDEDESMFENPKIKFFNNPCLKSSSCDYGYRKLNLPYNESDTEKLSVRKKRIEVKKLNFERFKKIFHHFNLPHLRNLDLILRV